MSADHPTLAEVVTATLHECGIDDADMVETPDIVRAWTKACTISTVAQLDALPPETVIKTEGGSIACRHYSGVGVVFGDDRPFAWTSSLVTELPGVLLWHPDWAQS